MHRETADHEPSAESRHEQVVVVIRTLGRAPLLQRALESLSQQKAISVGAVLLCVARGARQRVERSIIGQVGPLGCVWERVEDDASGGSPEAVRWLAESNRGSWIAFLDDDDVWPADHLARMTAGLQVGKVAVAPHRCEPECVGFQQPAIQADSRWAVERSSHGVGSGGVPLSCWVGDYGETVKWMATMADAPVMEWGRRLWRAAREAEAIVFPSAAEVHVSVRRWVPVGSVHAHRQRLFGMAVTRVSDWPGEGEEVETCKLSMKAVMPWPNAPAKPSWLVRWLDRGSGDSTPQTMEPAVVDERPLIDQLPVPLHDETDQAFLTCLDLCRTQCQGVSAASFLSADGWQMHRLGYEIGGVTAVGFVEWIWRRCRALNLRRVFFLGRDGFLFHAVAQRLFSQWPGELEGVYLPASRRLFEAADLVEWSAERLNRICTPARGATIGDWVKRLGLAWSDVEQSAVEVGWVTVDAPLMSEWAEPPERKAVKKRLKQLAELLRGAIMAAAVEAQQQLDDYVRASGLRSRDSCVVDLGWMGTSALAFQRALRRIEGPEAALTSFYFGHWSGGVSIEAEGGRLEAWFFHDQPFLAVKGLSVPMQRHQVILESVPMVEMLFSGTEGSVTGLRRTVNGVVELVRAEPEFTGQQAELLEQFHTAALAFAEAFAAVFPQPPVGARLDHYVEHALRRLLSLPTAGEGRLFGQFFPLEQHASDHAKRTLCHVPDLPRALWERHGVLNAAYACSFWRKGFRAQLEAEDLNLLPLG